MAEKIEAMLPSGEWVIIAEWEGRAGEASDWVKIWGHRIQGGIAPLPTGGMVNLGHFLAVRVN